MKKQKLKMRIGEIREEIFNTLPKDVADRINQVMLGLCTAERISTDNFLYGSEILSVKKIDKPKGKDFSDLYEFSLKHMLYQLKNFPVVPTEVYHTVVKYTQGKHEFISEQSPEDNETTYRAPRINS